MDTEISMQRGWDQDGDTSKVTMTMSPLWLKSLWWKLNTCTAQLLTQNGGRRYDGWNLTNQLPSHRGSQSHTEDGSSGQQDHSHDEMMMRVSSHSFTVTPWDVGEQNVGGINKVVQWKVIMSTSPLTINNYQPNKWFKHWVVTWRNL